MLALQVDALSASAGELATAARVSASGQTVDAMFEAVEIDLLELSKSIRRLVDTLPPDEPSRESIGGNGH